MNTEIKYKIHKLVDAVDNEHVLEHVYLLLNRTAENNVGELWSSLSLEQQDELLAIVEESKQYEKLLSHHDVKQKHKKWLE